MRYRRKIQRLAVGVRVVACWCDLATAVDEGEPMRPGTSAESNELGDAFEHGWRPTRRGRRVVLVGFEIDVPARQWGGACQPWGRRPCDPPGGAL